MASVGCPYFFQYEPQQGQPLDTHNTAIPYCRHKHSPAPLHDVLYRVDGWKLLRCGGDLNRCQVQLGKRLDVES